MTNHTVSVTSCKNCSNNRWNRPEPWGPAYPGPFGSDFHGTHNPATWSRPYNPRPYGLQPAPWDFKPYGSGFNQGEPAGYRPYRYGPR